MIPRITAGLSVVVVLSIMACRAENDQPSAAPSAQVDEERPVRFATFNTALHRPEKGQLAENLKQGDANVRKIAAIIQRIRPDVILLNEFDYDETGAAVESLLTDYLQVSQRGGEPIHYEHFYAAPVNTGVPSGMDLNHDGRNDGPADAFGYGRFPGEYGMLVLSKHEIQKESIRTFQHLLWKDMPDALLPVRPDSQEPYYTTDQLARLRLSSKSHWDIPITIDGKTVHFLVCHPTPPVFDGPEDRNGRRNHDEIRLLADYVHPDAGRNSYIYDDQGRTGGLSGGQPFVIAGDLNADPFDADSFNNAIGQLLEHVAIDSTTVVPASLGGPRQSEEQAGANENHEGDPAFDTADFADTDRGSGNLRVDYVLPSKSMELIDGGVFWPQEGEPGFELIDASDHRLVWIDVAL